MTYNLDHKPAELPDDPRECCRAILREVNILIDHPDAYRPLALAQLVSALADGNEMSDGMERSVEALRVLSGDAEDAAKAQMAAAERIHALARHGTCDHRDEKEAAA